jgi:hypothetical protein
MFEMDAQRGVSSRKVRFNNAAQPRALPLAQAAEELRRNSNAMTHRVDDFGRQLVLLC